LKNKYFLKEKRTYLQKAREAVLALFFSLKYDKNEILRQYLNTVFL
jgi:membrane peptidoglycan carboxypeptidase